jgi:ABC-type dipeptide/oligopeptide/nickel transport system permease component
MIVQALPISLQLGLGAMLVAAAAGITLGILAATRRSTSLDYLSMTVVLVGISVPTYVIAPLLVVLFAVVWHLVPTSGWHGLFAGTAVIPVFTLALGPTAGLARYTRSAVLDVIRLDFVRTGRAKGVRQGRLMVRHVLPNALISVLTVAGGYLAAVFTGAFFVESICAIPGMGRLIVQGISNRDYPVIFGVSLVVAAGVALINLAIDVSYAVIDPRVRYE